MTHNHPILKKCTCDECQAERGVISAKLSDYATDLMLIALHPPLVEIEALCAFVDVELSNSSTPVGDDWASTLAKVRAWLDKVNPNDK